MKNASRNHTIQLAVFSLASVMLWTPIIGGLASPERDVVIDPPARLLVILTITVQVIAILLGFIFHAIASGWDERQAHTASLVFGWIGYLVALIWAWWVAMSMLELPLPDGKLIVFISICVLYLIPAVVPVQRGRRRITVNLVAALLTLITSGVLTAERLSPILIAPATVYVVAILVSGVCARYANASSSSG